jgi:hypothetical protein
MRIQSAFLTGIILVMPMICGYYAKSSQAKTSAPDSSILQEPMFGFVYSYSRGNVHYDLVPTPVLRACPRLSVTEYIYAHAWVRPWRFKEVIVPSGTQRAYLKPLFQVMVTTTDSLMLKEFRRQSSRQLPKNSP